MYNEFSKDINFYITGLDFIQENENILSCRMYCSCGDSR